MTPARLSRSYPDVCAIVGALFVDPDGRRWLRRCARAGRRRGPLEATDVANDVAVLLLEQGEDVLSDLVPLDALVLEAVALSLAAARGGLGGRGRGDEACHAAAVAKAA